MPKKSNDKNLSERLKKAIYNFRKETGKPYSEIAGIFNCSEASAMNAFKEYDEKEKNQKTDQSGKESDLEKENKALKQALKTTTEKDNLETEDDPEDEDSVFPF